MRCTLLKDEALSEKRNVVSRMEQVDGCLYRNKGATLTIFEQACTNEQVRSYKMCRSGSDERSVTNPAV